MQVWAKQGVSSSLQAHTQPVTIGRAEHFETHESVRPPGRGRPWTITASGRVASHSHQSSGASSAAPASETTATKITRDDDGTGGPARASTARRAGRVGWRSGAACACACVCVLSGTRCCVPARARVVLACVRSGGNSDAWSHPTRLPYVISQADRRRKSPRQTRGG